jgi:very-short-patch-repair endonuclease
MYDLDVRQLTYPVVKIPALIANAKPQQIEHRSIVVEKINRIAKYPNSILRSNQIGYGLLFLSTLIFAIAVVRDVYFLPHSLISFCLGIAAINIASLLDSAQTPDPHIETKSIETIPIDYSSLLAGKVMAYQLPGEERIDGSAKAQKGVSESYFERYLSKYFDNILHPSYEFKIDENYRYSSDFTLILDNGISLIVEIDEPYNGKDNQPHHCIDVDKDDNRDEFFVNGNWIVIRFSEYQVCAYPIECCYVIARTIDSILFPFSPRGSANGRLRQQRGYANDLNSNLSRQFKGVKDLPVDRRWNTRQATQMAQQDYRLGYLEKYGVYKQKVAKTSKLLPLKRRIQR